MLLLLLLLLMLLQGTISKVETPHRGLWSNQRQLFWCISIPMEMSIPILAFDDDVDVL